MKALILMDIKVAQILASSSLNVFCWYLIFVCPQYGTCITLLAPRILTGIPDLCTLMDVIIF
jgi:hypothetical protein